MKQVIISILTGATGAAIATGLFTLIQYLLKRRDEKSDKHNAERKALRYIMLYIIQERAKDYIRAEKITLNDRRSLHHWHDLYHSGLGGNGDADALMAQIDSLPLETED